MTGPGSDRGMARSGSGGISARAAWLVLMVVLLTTGQGLLQELRFFSPGALRAQNGWLPAPQYNPGNPLVNAAAQRAAAYLTSGTVCVIDADAWSDDYQRVAFLLQPVDVWPIQTTPSQKLPSASASAAALRAHGARCLLARTASEVPAGLTRRTEGAYSLYLVSGSRAP